MPVIEPLSRTALSTSNALVLLDHLSQSGARSQIARSDLDELFRIGIMFRQIEDREGFILHAQDDSALALRMNDCSSILDLPRQPFTARADGTGWNAQTRTQAFLRFGQRAGHPPQTEADWENEPGFIEAFGRGLRPPEHLMTPRITALEHTLTFFWPEIAHSTRQLAFFRLPEEPMSLGIIKSEFKSPFFFARTKAHLLPCGPLLCSIATHLFPGRLSNRRESIISFINSRRVHEGFTTFPFAYVARREITSHARLESYGFLQNNWPRIAAAIQNF